MISSYISLTRPHQWYKNLLIFLGMIFAGKLTELYFYPKVFLGFLILILVSGANYVINDIVDLEKDREHPEKRKRPLPSGMIKRSTAVAYAAILFVVSIILAFNQNIMFGITVLALFLTLQLYNFWLKNIIFADVIMIAVGFVWRAVAGLFIISIPFSYWIVICTFFLALLLALSKRKGELYYLKERALYHRPVLNQYTPELLNACIVASSSALILSYSMYSFLAHEGGLIIVTIPVATFLIFRYLYLSYTNSVILTNPERAFFDKEFVVGIFIWLVMVILVVYV